MDRDKIPKISFFGIPLHSLLFFPILSSLTFFLIQRFILSGLRSKLVHLSDAFIKHTLLDCLFQLICLLLRNSIFNQFFCKFCIFFFLLNQFQILFHQHFFKINIFIFFHFQAPATLICCLLLMTYNFLFFTLFIYVYLRIIFNFSFLFFQLDVLLVQ